MSERDAEKKDTEIKHLQREVDELHILMSGRNSRLRSGASSTVGTSDVARSNAKSEADAGVRQELRTAMEELHKLHEENENLQEQFDLLLESSEREVSRLKDLHDVAEHRQLESHRDVESLNEIAKLEKQLFEAQTELTINKTQIDDLTAEEVKLLAVNSELKEHVLLLTRMTQEFQQTLEEQKQQLDELKIESAAAHTQHGVDRAELEASLEAARADASRSAMENTRLNDALAEAQSSLAQGQTSTDEIKSRYDAVVVDMVSLQGQLAAKVNDAQKAVEQIKLLEKSNTDCVEQCKALLAELEKAKKSSLALEADLVQAKALHDSFEKNQVRTPFWGQNFQNSQCVLLR